MRKLVILILLLNFDITYHCNTCTVLKSQFHKNRAAINLFSPTQSPGDLKSIPGIESVSMTTNGVTLSRHLPALVEAGLDNVNISLWIRFWRLVG